MPKHESDSELQIQLRGCRAMNAETKAIVGEHWGGGVGFFLAFGDTPLRPRLRFDYDHTFWENGLGLETRGVGLDAALTIPDFEIFSPVISLGPTVQRWSTGGIDTEGKARREHTGLAFRAEAGIAIGHPIALTVGCLYGGIGDGRKATILYGGVTFRM